MNNILWNVYQAIKDYICGGKCKLQTLINDIYLMSFKLMKIVKSLKGEIEAYRIFMCCKIVYLTKQAASHEILLVLYCIVQRMQRTSKSRRIGRKEKKGCLSRSRGFRSRRRNSIGESLFLFSPFYVNTFPLNRENDSIKSQTIQRILFDF